jgi:hypothetical protein
VLVDLNAIGDDAEGDDAAWLGRDVYASAFGCPV